GVEMWLLLRARRPSVAEASPSPGGLQRAPTPTTMPAIIEDIVTVTPPEPEPEPTFEPETVTQAAPTPPPLAPPTAPPPAPSPVAVTTPPPRPATTPAPPVNPVPGLMAQADQARAAGRYREAIAAYDEVLKLEPQNKEAATGKLRATGERASTGRYFLTAVTMSEGKSKGGGIPGFDGANVVKSPCECAITYEVTPENPRQEQPYSVGIYLQNDSKRDIKPESLTIEVRVNGRPAPRNVPLRAREVSRGKRALIGTLEDTWKLGTTSWSLDAAVKAGDNTYRAQLTWELKL
ncbi:MAG TPA: tetratricopeptide repeat protein, partial [Vicinamibacteria bacterium]|nr:tetratricopeptide repeat protein [Vicinamibacteria bacterium]